MLAIDCEMDSMFSYRTNLCLLQVGWPGGDALIDTLVDLDLSTLGALFADATVAKVYVFLRRQTSVPIELTQQEIRDQMQLKTGAEGVGAAIRILDRTASAVRRLDSNEKHGLFWINRLNSEGLTHSRTKHKLH